MAQFPPNPSIKMNTALQSRNIFLNISKVNRKRPLVGFTCKCLERLNPSALNPLSLPIHLHPFAPTASCQFLGNALILNEWLQKSSNTDKAWVKPFVKDALKSFMSRKLQTLVEARNRLRRSPNCARCLQNLKIWWIVTVLHTKLYGLNTGWMRI